MTTRRHFICLPCRAAYKTLPPADRPCVCRRCGGELIDAGQDLAVPKRRDAAGWRALGAVLNAGITFHSRCCEGPGWRPRHPREIRERLAAARQTGVPVRTALITEDLDALRGQRRS
ncbi:hypothetical protein ACWGIB_11925 [Streptomyces xiamenensis]